MDDKNTDVYIWVLKKKIKIIMKRMTISAGNEIPKLKFLYAALIYKGQWKLIWNCGEYM